MQPMTLLFQKVDHRLRVLCRLPDSDQPSNEAWWQRSRSKVANPCYEISHSCQEWCPARWAGTHMSRSTSMPSWPFFHTPGETWIPTCSSLCSKWVTTFFVRESVQTMALHNGFPVLRLQATVVSRWFVIPTAQLDQHLAHWVFQWPYDSVLASKKNPPTHPRPWRTPLPTQPSRAFELLLQYMSPRVAVSHLHRVHAIYYSVSQRRKEWNKSVSLFSSRPGIELVTNWPRMGIILGKLKLVLRNDIRILVEYNEPHGAVSGHQRFEVTRQTPYAYDARSSTIQRSNQLILLEWAWHGWNRWSSRLKKAIW